MSLPVEIVSVHFTDIVLEDRTIIAHFKAKIGPFTARRGSIAEYFDGVRGINVGGRDNGGFTLHSGSKEYADLEEAALAAFYAKGGPR